MDYNATTPLEPEVMEAVTEALQDAWGNPSSNYVAGVEKFMSSTVKPMFFIPKYCFNKLRGLIPLMFLTPVLNN